MDQASSLFRFASSDHSARSLWLLFGGLDQSGRRKTVEVFQLSRRKSHTGERWWRVLAEKVSMGLRLVPLLLSPKAFLMLGSGESG